MLSTFTLLANMYIYIGTACGKSEIAVNALDSRLSMSGPASIQVCMSSWNSDTYINPHVRGVPGCTISSTDRSMIIE